VPNARLTLSAAHSAAPMSAYADVGLTDTAFGTSTTATDANGQFTLLGAPPGEYVLRAMVLRTPGSGQTIVRNGDGTVTTFATVAPEVRIANSGTLSAELPIGVPDHDITGLTVTLQPDVNVSGTITFAGGTAPSLNTLRVSLMDASGQPHFGQPQGPARDHFLAGPVPRGAYALSIALPGWTVKSVRIGGKEIGDGLFSLTTDVDDAVVTMTNRLAGVAGTVQRSGVDAAVAIFPADFQSWIASGMPSSRARLVDADKNGTFDADGLVGGDYAVAAIDANTAVDLQNPADIEALARIATRITLGDGDQKTLSLSIGRLH
jgi:hypothetical protein